MSSCPLLSERSFKCDVNTGYLQNTTAKDKSYMAMKDLIGTWCSQKLYYIPGFAHTCIANHILPTYDVRIPRVEHTCIANHILPTYDVCITLVEHTCIANHILPSYDVCITLMELSITVIFHLEMVILQHVPDNNFQRLDILYLHKPLHIFFPAKL